MTGWQKKQDVFLAFLEEHGAQEAPYRVNLEQRKIFWLGPENRTLVVADCRVILTYALSNESVMMGWANRSFASEQAVEPVEGVADYYQEMTPEDVWGLTMEVATAAQAEYLYRAPSPQSWVMLALWNLRTGGDERFTSGSPKRHVLEVLEMLRNHGDNAELMVLLNNYAESFLQMAGHSHADTDYREPLRDTARGMRNLLIYVQNEQSKEFNKGVNELKKLWKKY